MTITRCEISAEEALTIVQSAIAHAQANGWNICAAVCDPRGGLVAFHRTDNVIAPAESFAIDKAYTAATLRKASGEFGQRMSESPTLSLGIGTRARLLTWQGGLAIFDNAVCIGGIGVSGAADFEDVACAKAAGFQTSA